MVGLQWPPQTPAVQDGPSDTKPARSLAVGQMVGDPWQGPLAWSLPSCWHLWGLPGALPGLGVPPAALEKVRGSPQDLSAWARPRCV